MNITFLHEIDTGFMAATLKPAFERLGHHCTVMQGWKTHIEPNLNHVDYLLSEVDDTTILKREFEATDLFIIRATDALMYDTGVIPYLTAHNTIFRLHGYDLLELNRPYSLTTWRINLFNKHPFICTYNDPTFIGRLHGNVFYIERPMNFDILPRRKKTDEVFALMSPTNMYKKGAQALSKTWKSNGITLKIIANTTRTEVLELKAQASYMIDNVEPNYDGGPYGMNSVEAWYMRIPTFSRYHPWSTIVCPELPLLTHNVTLDNVQQTIEEYEVDKRQLKYAHDYALRTHDPVHIAQQYITLKEGIE